jgi:predicted DNA-binding helix-hairpin-helix protein
MIDFKTAQVRRHQQNIKRYCRLLATELTDLERQYLHKRIAEEYTQLKRLEESQAVTTSSSLTPLIIGATEATDQEADAKRNGGGREGALLDHLA